MKRKASILILATMIVTALIFLSACGGGPKLKGTWVNPESDATAAIELGSKTFYSEGLGFPGATLDSGASGTYEVEDDTMIVTFSDGTVQEYPMEKVNGVWALHANYFNPDLIWVHEDDVDKYLKGNE